MLDRFIGWAHAVQAAQTRAHENVEARLTESEPSANPSARLDVDTPTAVGRITCWDSGDYDAEAIDLQTERSLYTDRGTLREGEEMSKKFSPFFKALGIA
ncbi:immunity protein TriTu family protein [Variovorax boronicumulans]|uniref:immunity protein TriTu family protein n=1 Tax=Variovorax boronicumulans TaxID=436515 RepID=UPI0027D7EF37|nr:hypothetical protein [Variovorax boronicumulans]